MKEKLLSFDLGTGGVKACIYSKEGELLASSYREYKTYFPVDGYQEQKPADWWHAVVDATIELTEKHRGYINEIAGIGVSGHSLGVVALTKEGHLATEFTPIWSDTRANRQAEVFFQKQDYEQWYSITGGGFPAHLYSIFKIKWYSDNKPDIYNTTDVFIGTKDYINYMLTGNVCSDYSYASGSGVYDLKNHVYVDEWLDKIQIPIEKLPKLCHSSDIIGKLSSKAAKEMQLMPGIAVVCGGVDNACTALGAGCYMEGDAYTSLGTSAWIAVSSKNPVIDIKTKPYVFEHCVSGQYVSANCIFSAGNSFRWVKNELCKEMSERANVTGKNVYDLMTEAAEESKIGSNGVIFLPALAGGCSLDPSEDLRGGYVGLDLSHTLNDIIRASMEGIALHLRRAIDAISTKTCIAQDMLIVGGGSKSNLWMQIFADVYDKTVLTSEVGQNAGALGAAALAALGLGLIKDFNIIRNAHSHESRFVPNKEAAKLYSRIFPIFQRALILHSELDCMIKKLCLK